MKNLIYIFLLLICTSITNLSFGQKIDEKLIFSGTDQNNIDAFSFYTGDNGNYAYVEYDQNTSQSRLLTNKGTSEYYDVVNAEAKFDNEGNNYTSAYNYRKDTTYLVDTYFLLMNGQKVAEMTSMDTYNAYINSSNELQFVVTEGDKQYIAKYSPANGLTKTGPYDVVKSIFAEIDESAQPMEGDGKVAQNLFKNKNEDYGYIVVKDNRASIVFGNDIANTQFTDILETSFTYDRNGNLTYIGKANGQFYSGYGREFVVQGDKIWNEFGSVNPPVRFTKDNTPVYVTMDSINENTYLSRLVIGNDYYKVKTSTGAESSTGYSGGIFDLKVQDNGSISYTGQTQIITKNPDGYDDYAYKSVNVNNGVEGKGYFNQGVTKYNKTGSGLFSGSAAQKDKKVSLFMTSGNNAKVVSEKKYDGISDYDFINGGNKYYYIGTTYGDYEKGTRDKSDVYINGDFVGEYETIAGQSTDNGGYSSIIFNNSGDYAFIVQNSNEKKVGDDVQYDYTSEIVSNKDIDMPSMPRGAKQFSYIDNLRFLKNGKLFYIGYLYPNESTTESYLVVDGKIIGKPYTSLNNTKYDRNTNTMTYRASRGNNLYDVKINF